MNLLLDTHALIWFLQFDPYLSSRAAAAIADQDNVSYVSYASAWELAIKLPLRKLKIPVPFEQLFPDVLLALGFEILPIAHSHLRAVLELPQHHRDPFDRLLIAQAQVGAMTLVTSDRQFGAYGIPLLW